MSIFDGFSGDYAQISMALFVNDMTRQIVQIEKMRQEAAFNEIDSLINGMVEDVYRMREEMDAAIKDSGPIGDFNVNHRIERAIDEMAKAEKEFWGNISRAEEHRFSGEYEPLLNLLKFFLLSSWERFITLQRDYIISIQAPSLVTKINPQVVKDMDDFRPLHEDVMNKIYDAPKTAEIKNYLKLEKDLNKVLAEMGHVFDDLLNNWVPIKSTNNSKWIKSYETSVGNFYTALRKIKESGEKILG